MKLSSVRGLKQELGAKMPLDTQALADPTITPLILAKGIMRLGPNEYGLALRVYEGKEQIALQAVKFLSRHRREVQLIRGVSYRPRGAPAGMLTSGLSIGHPKITAGTLGGFVHDREGVYVLSNNHVLANSNRAKPYDPIMTPGPSDLDEDRDYRVIGRLHRWMELREHAPKSLDAAIAKLPRGAKYRPSFVPGVGRVARTPIEDRFAVHSVFKYGRTTKLTRGVATAFEIDDIVVNYGTPKRPRWLQFDNQIEFVSPKAGKVFSKAGDSGSVIYDAATRRPYALLFAGGKDGTGRDRTLGHFLPDVLEALGVEML